MGWQFDSDRPIYTQLLEQIQQRIIAGIYGPGEKLPPVRELAMEAGVNPNTMQKAMAELERTGLIHAQRTTGRFVTEDIQMIHDLRQQLALDKIAGFLCSMQELGYERAEVLDLMRQSPYVGEAGNQFDKEADPVMDNMDETGKEDVE